MKDQLASGYKHATNPYIIHSVKPLGDEKQECEQVKKTCFSFPQSFNTGLIGISLA